MKKPPAEYNIIPVAKPRQTQADKIKIVIPGTPIPKRRPRFARHGRRVVTYNDQEFEAKQAKLFVYQQIKTCQAMPLTGPINAEIIFYMPRPKAHYGTGKNSGILKKTALLYHINKPDLDNLTKWIYDIFNKIVWKDDAQIIFEKAEKRYSENPRTEVCIKEIDDSDKSNRQRAYKGI